MGVLTALQIATSAAGQMGISPPSSLENTSDSALNWLGAVSQMGVMLARDYTWQELTFRTTFVAAATEDQSAFTTLLGAGFSRIVPDSFFNVTQQRKCLGPTSPQDWAALKATGSAAPVDYYRMLGGVLNIYPAPNGVDTYALDWVSSYPWAVTATPTVGAKSRPSLNSDVWLLDDELGIAATALVWKTARGLDTTLEEAMFQSIYKAISGANKIASTIDVSMPRAVSRPGIYFPVLVP
jgi:hypothetical protein